MKELTVDQLTDEDFFGEHDALVMVGRVEEKPGYVFLGMVKRIPNFQTQGPEDIEIQQATRISPRYARHIAGCLITEADFAEGK